MKYQNIAQFSKEGKNTMRSAFNQFLDQLIIENKKTTPDGYSLKAYDLPYEDKKAFLLSNSH
jgi:hypothetical protein